MCMRVLLLLLMLALASFAHADAGTRDKDVDVALVLVVDVSGSVQSDEFDLERNGIATAFSSPEIIAAVEGGALGRIAVSVVFFASPEETGTVVPWTVISDEASAEHFAWAMSAAQRSGNGSTSISSGMTLAAKMIANSPYRATRRVIDVSGDGANNLDLGGTDNGSIDMTSAHALCASQHITVNGLAIVNQEPDIADYYRHNVISGTGAFLIVAKGVADFARAIRRKLVQEIT